jgi:hypothetical protein
MAPLGKRMRSGEYLDTGNFTCVTSCGACACAIHAVVWCMHACSGLCMPAPVQGFEGFIEYSFALITRLMDINIFHSFTLDLLSANINLYKSIIPANFTKA